MKGITLGLLAALALAGSAFAKGHPSTGTNKVVTHPDSPSVAAKKNFDSAQTACAHARVAYQDKAFAGGQHDEKELASLDHAKFSACNSATSAHTAWMNALNAERGNHFTARSSRQLEVNAAEAAARKQKTEAAKAAAEKAKAAYDAENDAVKDLDDQIKDANKQKPAADPKKP